MRSGRRPWPGWFITFEGLDGSGKTTQLRVLGQYLRQRQRATVLETREPGGTPIAEDIRNLVLDPNNVKLVPRAELFLFLAARAQHFEEAILPALERGEVVLCDRFADATFAYQHGGRGFPLDDLRQFNRFAAQDHRPDLTLLLDIDARTAERRTRGRGEWLSRFDMAPTTFHTSVRKVYMDLAKKEPRRVKVIDATKPLAVVQERIRKLIDALDLNA